MIIYGRDLKSDQSRAVHKTKISSLLHLYYDMIIISKVKEIIFVNAVMVSLSSIDSSRTALVLSSSYSAVVLFKSII